MAGTAQIGALNVRLGIDAAQFSAGLKSSQANLAKFGKTAALAGAAIASAFGIGFVQAIGRIERMNKVSAQLDRALANTGNSARTSAREVAQFADDLERKTGRAAEEVMDISTNLATFGFGREVFFEAIELADDMAAAWGGDLRQNAEGLARALAAPTEGLAMLTKRGITFTEQQQAMIAGFMKSNDLASAQGVILAALNEQVDGVAEAGFGGLSKALSHINQSLEEVFEQVANAALPALQSLAETLASPEFATAAASLATTMVSAFDTVVQAVVATTNAIQGFLDWLNEKGGSAKPLVNDLLPGEKLNFADRIRASSISPDSAAGLYRGFDFGADGKMNVQKPAAGNAFAPVTAGAGAAKTAVTDLMAGIEDAQPKVENFAETISDSLANSFTNFADAVLSGVPAIEALSDVLGNLGKQLLNSAISNFFGGLFGGGGGLFKPAPKLGVDFGLGLFAGGGITDRPAIFGDAGPEAAVPLPDGRSIPVTLSGNTGGGGMTEVLIRLDQGMVAQILKQADNNAVQIVKSQAPAAVMQTQRNRG